MNLEKLRPDKYLKYLKLPKLFAPKRTKEILSVNPTIIPNRKVFTSLRKKLKTDNSKTRQGTADYKLVS